ncbi:MAG TPA: polysaccharide biosynthesis protein [Candidatus Avacidaminococcus intestinavium]|uniref:Polysaccharide biosynthesis protein n=1 Tax=Candidatus Avacidaminococcus intestinavium TaxID=2840684 RepID=A0A9D1MPJ7_9FIRM|nr:polysaccharide biosynthesis protein [Candidatus Avacidaminococcus intestinavium]
MRKYLLSAFFVVCDVLIVVLAVMASVYIRFEGAAVDYYLRLVLRNLPLMLVTYLLFFLFFNLYRRIWRYAGIRELLAVTGATFAATAFYALAYKIFGHYHLPGSLLLIIFLLITAGVGLSRMAVRITMSLSVNGQNNTGSIPVLIIGAGDAGYLMASDIQQYYATERKVVAFIDDDPAKKNNLILGVKVIGGRDKIAETVLALGIKEIIIAIPSLSAKATAELVELCSHTKVTTKIVPGIYSLLDNNINMSLARPVGVEDLLQRDPVKLDLDKIASFLTGKRVLVTGAGGSIGSEVCRQVMRMKPAQLVLLGKGENSIYEIHQELSKLYGKEHLVPVIASVRDEERMTEVFDMFKPQVVFHAAAHKHVPLMEAQPAEAVSNNVCGTRRVAKLAGLKNVEIFIMVSTDKAVNPTSVMGATKRTAEKIIQAFNARYPTKYITVRFGNVLGSRGSVVPLFKKQIEAGGPVTVTHPDMKRYFMTIPEATQLILQAGSMGEGGEVFVLDMGEPVKIVDLAKNMIRLMGHEPDGDIKITFTGLRPGEKLFEELLSAEEGTTRTVHEKIHRAVLREEESERMKKLLAKFDACETDLDYIEVLQEIVPTYKPNHFA